MRSGGACPQGFWRCRVGGAGSSLGPVRSRRALPLRASAIRGSLLRRAIPRRLPLHCRFSHTTAPCRARSAPRPPSRTSPCFFTRHSGFALGYPLATLGPHFVRRLPCPSPRPHLGRQPLNPVVSSQCEPLSPDPLVLAQSPNRASPCHFARRLSPLPRFLIMIGFLCIRL